MLLRREILGPPMSQMSESKAREQGLKFRRKYEKASDWYTARRVAETVYGSKHWSRKTASGFWELDESGIDEVINLFAFAIRNGLTAEDLRRQSSPTQPVPQTSAIWCREERLIKTHVRVVRACVRARHGGSY